MRFFVQDTEEFENNGIEYKSLDKANDVLKNMDTNRAEAAKVAGDAAWK